MLKPKMKKRIALLILFLPLFANAQQFKWIKQTSSPYVDEGHKISVDNAGNVYTFGVSGEGGPVDFDPGSGVYEITVDGLFLSKMDPAGNLIWARAFNTMTFQPYASSISFDTNNNVYITGSF